MLMCGFLALLATIGATLCVAILPAAALASSPPSEVHTEPAEVIPGGAKLKGKLNPGGLPTTYHFVYARDTCDEGCTPSKTASSGPLTGDTQQEVPAIEVTGLATAGSEAYWYILVATNADGTVEGAPVNFTPGASLPSIESESVSHVASTDATIEAKINPEDLPEGAYYQFQIVKSTSEYLPELTCPEPEVLPPSRPDDCDSPDSQRPTPGALPIGYIAKGPEGQSVSLDLASAGVTLQPSTTYHYRVLAAKRAQSEDGVDWQAPFVEGPDRTFTTPAPPAIESVSVSGLTEHDATLEAQINTQGLETSYQFLLSAICGGKGACLVVVNYPLPSGLLLGAFVDQSVSLDLNTAGVTLQSGGTYTYSVSATNASGRTESVPHNFTTPENVVQPLSPSITTSSLSDGDQPAGSASSTPDVQSPDLQVPKTTKLEPLTNAQKLAAALRACKREPKKKQASCKKQARERMARRARRQASKGKK